MRGDLDGEVGCPAYVLETVLGQPPIKGTFEVVESGGTKKVFGIKMSIGVSPPPSTSPPSKVQKRVHSRGLVGRFAISPTVVESGNRLGP